MPFTKVWSRVGRLRHGKLLTSLDDGYVSATWRLARIDDEIGSLLTYAHIASEGRDWGDAEYLFENRGDRQDPLLPVGRHLHSRTSRLIHVARYLFAASKFGSGEGGHVLDVACGLGYGAEIVMESRSGGYVGVDIADDAVAYGKRHYERPGRRYVVGDGTSIPIPDDSVSAITSFETMEHVPEDEVYLSELRRVTAEGADLLVSVPYDEPEDVLRGEWNRSKDYPHLESYDYNKLVSRLEGAFPEARIEVYEQVQPDESEPYPPIERREGREQVDLTEHFERRSGRGRIRDDAPALVAHVSR